MARSTIWALELPDSLTRLQQTAIINEDGLYDVILESRKPEARAFRKWVTSDVLPTIRRSGGYVANDDLFIQTYLPHADEQTQMMFSVTLETVRKANEQIAIMQPKADYFESLNYGKSAHSNTKRQTNTKQDLMVESEHVLKPILKGRTGILYKQDANFTG